MADSASKNEPGTPPGNAAPDDDIPVLTDIAPDPVLIATGTAIVGPDSAEGSGAASPVEVISRVQVQNLQHSVFQKLRKDIDGRIEHVVREQFMPDIGSALNSALEHITQELQGNITQMVRTSIEQVLHAQLGTLRNALEAKGAAEGDARSSTQFGTAPGAPAAGQ